MWVNVYIYNTYISYICVQKFIHIHICTYIYTEKSHSFGFLDRPVVGHFISNQTIINVDSNDYYIEEDGQNIKPTVRYIALHPSLLWLPSSTRKNAKVLFRE